MHVLVAYASKRGSTAEIAEEVAETLRSHDLDVTCELASGISDLDPYDAVVLGSAVYMKRWRGDAAHFLRHHHRALGEMPSGSSARGPLATRRRTTRIGTSRPGSSARSRIWERVSTSSSGVVFRLSPLGPIEKAMVGNTPPAYRDRRDWGQVRAWASTIAEALGDSGPQRS